MAQPTRAAARCARLRRPFSRQNLPDAKLVARIYRAVPGQCLALRKRGVPGAPSQFLSQRTNPLGLREGSPPLRPPRGRYLSRGFHRQRSGRRRYGGDRTAHRRVLRVARGRATVLIGPLPFDMNRRTFLTSVSSLAALEAAPVLAAGGNARNRSTSLSPPDCSPMLKTFFGSCRR